MTEASILVAEDSTDIRQLLEDTVLKPAGYAVRSVGDGMSALALARELKPDLIITDQNMPNLSGTEMARRLHFDLPYIPVILITSEGSEGLAVEAMRSGVVDYLTKPFEAELLLAAVGRALATGRRWQTMVSVQSEAEANTQALEHRLHELETLAHIGRTVTATLDQDAVLTTVVEAAVRLTEAEEGSLLLLDEDTGELYMRAPPRTSMRSSPGPSGCKSRIHLPGK